MFIHYLIYQQGDKYFISCPSCRKPTQLPDIGPTEFPTAFFINSLFQLQNTLKKAFEDRNVSCDNCHKNSATGYCKQCTQFLCPKCLDAHNTWLPFSTHEVINVQDVAVLNTSKLLPLNEDRNTKCNDHNEPIKVYCETCQELICRDCTISKRHRNHDYNLVTESYPKHHQEIEADLTKVKTKVANITTAVTNLITQEREVTKQGEDVKKQIHTQSQLLINLVQHSERQLVQQVDTAVQQKIQLLTKQREEAETVLKQLKGCEEFVEQSLKVGSQQQILREKQNMVQVMTTVNQDVNPVVFQPIDEANITFTSNHTLVDKYEGIGEFKSKTFGKSVLVKNACYVGKKSTVTLNLQTQGGSPFSVPLSLISCELSSAGNSQLVSCDINETQSGNYDISFTPCTREKHQLTIRLGGVNIPGSPFTLFPEMRGKPVNIISGLNGPYGVVVSKNEEIIVAENDANCITILNKEGKKVKSFGTRGTKEGQFTNPRGVTISQDGHILVTDNHRLQKLTFEGDCVKSVGSSKTGNGPLQFNGPTGITVYPTTGQIFVADMDNHRIRVLNNDLTYSHSFVKEGSSPEQFNLPCDVTFDNEGYLYVADFNNHCIKKFTPAGQYISTFSSEGSNPGQIKQPTSIIIDNNLLYVSEYGNDRISIFDTNGRFIHCFGKSGSGEGEFNLRYGITIDSLGNLYVSDTDNNRLVVL